MTSVKLINHSSSTADWNYYKIMICKPDSILDDIWSKVKAVCIDYDLPDELRILKVMLRNKMSTGFCYLF